MQHAWFYTYILVVTTSPDAEDPFWDDMGVEADPAGPQELTSDSGSESDMVAAQDNPDTETDPQGSPMERSKLLQDSGFDSSLACTPGDVVVDLNLSRESGEITDDDEVGTDRVQHVVKNTEPTTIVDNGYVAGSLYVPASLAESLVLQDPPALILSAQLGKTPVAGTTIITDRVGINLTKRDKVIYMQNNVSQDYWQLANKIMKYQVAVQFKYVIVCIGLDWCLDVKKQVVKEGLRQLLYSVNKITNNRAIVGVCGVTPIYENYRETKCKTVTFNRWLSEAVRECSTGERGVRLPFYHYTCIFYTMTESLSPHWQDISTGTHSLHYQVEWFSEKQC